MKNTWCLGLHYTILIDYRGRLRPKINEVIVGYDIYFLHVIYLLGILQ